MADTCCPCADCHRPSSAAPLIRVHIPTIECIPCPLNEAICGICLMILARREHLVKQGDDLRHRPSRIRRPNSGCDGRQSPHGGEHLLGVAGHPDLPPNIGDPATRIDQQRRAFNAHIFAPEHRLLGPYPIGPADFRSSSDASTKFKLYLSRNRQWLARPSGETPMMLAPAAANWDAKALKR